MKKVIAAVLILAILAVGAWLILLRPSENSEGSLSAVFAAKKEHFVTIAEYLTENNISATIDGLISMDDRQGVPNVNDNRYKKFNDANTVIMRENIEKIVSDGSRVEFVFSDDGGLLNKADARIIYDKNEVGAPAKPLGEKNWYLRIEK